MNEEKFWKIIYLHIKNYNYEIIHHRVEKKDIWLINKKNEIVRFVYVENLKSLEIDSSIYNIIKNEKIFKKKFKLNILKIKVVYISKNIDENIIEYKKYKISGTLSIERIIFNEKNKNNFIKESDYRFIETDNSIDRYKNRVISYFKNNKNNTRFLINFKFLFIGIFLVFLFLINFLIQNYTNLKLDIYKFLNYNYQNIISGHFYKLFTNVIIFSNIVEVIFIFLFIVIYSILLYDGIKIKDFILISINIALIYNLFTLFGYYFNTSIISLSFFGFLGSVFIYQFNQKNNNLKIIYSLALPIVYILFFIILFDKNVSIYMFSFVLGIFLKILYLKKRNVIISYFFKILLITLGFLVLIFNFNLKGSINNYVLKKVENRLLNYEYNDDKLKNLEYELHSNNKSILTYYELGMVKLQNVSISEAKNIFLEGLSFDNTFAPLYYQLALISRSELDKDAANKYINRALELDSSNEKYKVLKDEVSKK